MSLQWHDGKRPTSLVPVHEERDAYHRNGIFSSVEDCFSDFTGDPRPALPCDAIDKALVSPTMANRKQFNPLDMALKSPSIAKRKLEDVPSKLSPRKGGRKATVKRDNDMSTSPDVSPSHCEVSLQNQQYLISANLHLKRFFWKSAKISYAKDGQGNDDRTPLDKLKHVNDTVLKSVRTTMRIAKALDDVKECSEQHREQRILEEEQERIRSEEAAMEMHRRSLQHAANLESDSDCITEIDWLGSTVTRHLVEQSSEDGVEDLQHLTHLLQRAMQNVMELCSVDLSYLDDIGSSVGSRFLSDMCTRLQASYQGAAKVIQKMHCRIQAEGNDGKMCRALDELSAKLTKAVSCKLRGEKVDLSLFDGITSDLGLIMRVSKGGDDSQQAVNARTRWARARKLANSDGPSTKEDAAKGRLSYLSCRSSILSNSGHRESHRGSTWSTGLEFCLVGTTHPEVIGAHKMPANVQRKGSIDGKIGPRASVGHHRLSRTELLHESETDTMRAPDGHDYVSNLTRMVPSYERKSIKTNNEPPTLMHHVPNDSNGRQAHERYSLAAIVQDTDPEHCENNKECPEYHPEQPSSEKRNPFRRRSTVVQAQAVVTKCEPEKKKKQEGSPYTSSSSSQPDASRVAKFLWKQDGVKKSELAMVEFSRSHATSPIKPKSLVIGGFEDEKLTAWSLDNTTLVSSAKPTLRLGALKKLYVGRP